mgnify:CR=1 FL=1
MYTMSAQQISLPDLSLAVTLGSAQEVSDQVALTLERVKDRSFKDAVNTVMVPGNDPVAASQERGNQVLQFMQTDAALAQSLRLALQQLVRLWAVLRLLVEAARDEVDEFGREGVHRERGRRVVDDLREQHEVVAVLVRWVWVLAQGALDERDAEDDYALLPPPSLAAKRSASVASSLASGSVASNLAEAE